MGVGRRFHCAVVASILNALSRFEEVTEEHKYFV